MIRARLVLLVLLFASAPAFAQTSVTGDWNVTITGPQGPTTTKVAFTQEGDKVSGRFKSPQGELPFSGGTLTGSDLKFVFTVQFQGMPLDITLTGKVNGDKMAGKADFGGFVEGDWTAERAAAATTASTTTAAAASTTASTTTSTATATPGGAGGEWDVTLKTPGGDFPATAKLSEEGGAIKGTFGSQMGEVPVTGTHEGKSVKLSMTAVTPNGEMNVVMTGDIDGDSIVNGKAEIAGMGQMEWTAKRKQ